MGLKSSKRVGMYTCQWPKTGMTGRVPPYTLAAHQGVGHFRVFRQNLCEFPTSLRVVSAGFARSYRLYEGNTFLLAATRSNSKLHENCCVTEGYCWKWVQPKQCSFHPILLKNFHAAMFLAIFLLLALDLRWIELQTMCFIPVRVKRTERRKREVVPNWLVYMQISNFQAELYKGYRSLMHNPRKCQVKIS